MPEDEADETDPGAFTFSRDISTDPLTVGYDIGPMKYWGPGM